MEKKQSALETLEFIKKNFQPGQKINAKTLKKLYLDDTLNVSYFMSQLVKKGEITQLQRGLWCLPGKAPSDHLGVLYISKIERNILDVIFKMELRSENNLSRFGLDSLKELISEEEKNLLVDLIPKLKNAGIISCVGNGEKGKILEIKEHIFLKYMTEPELIKEISLTDLEIDQKIKRFISEEERKEKRANEIIEEKSTKEDELLTCLAEIETLTKTKDILEKEISSLDKELKKIESLATESEVEKQFVKIMSDMDPERRRNIFKKLLS
jgi:hypothetical protein